MFPKIGFKSNYVLFLKDPFSLQKITWQTNHSPNYKSLDEKQL